MVVFQWQVADTSQQLNLLETIELTSVLQYRIIVYYELCIDVGQLQFHEL